MSDDNLEKNTPAFEELYNTHKADIYGYVIGYLRDESGALDIVQDTFLNFFNFHKNTEILPDPLLCRKYLFRIARNLIINHGKTAYKRRVELVGDYQEREPVSGEGEESLENRVVEGLHNQELDRRFRNLLWELKEEEATALILRYNLDMNLEDIGEVLSRSTSAISRLLSRAVSRLKELGVKRGFPGAEDS